MACKAVVASDWSSSATAWSATASSSCLGERAAATARPPFDVTVSARSRGSPTTASACRRSSTARRADDLALVAPGQYEARRHRACALGDARRARIDRARRDRRRSAAGARSPTTSWCWRPARRRSCRRCPGATAAAASSTARSRTSRRSAPAAATRRSVGVVIGGGLLGLEAANALRKLGLEDARRRVRAAPDGAAARRRGRRACCAQRIEELGVVVHTGDGHHARSSPATTARVARAAVRRRHRAGRRRWSSSRPASARATSWRAPPGSRVGERGGIVDRRRAAAPPTRDIFAIGECALLRRAHLRPGRARLRDGARSRVADARGRRRRRFTGVDMSTKLKLMGVDVASFGDAFARARRARTSSASSTRAAGVYKKLVVVARRQAPARRHPGRRRRRLRRSCCSWRQNQIAAAAAPRGPDPAGARRRQAGRRSASTRCPTRAQICSCNNVSKGAICERHPRAEADRRRRGQELHQGRHRLRRLRAAGRRELLKAELKTRRRRGQQPPLRALPAHAARSSSTSSRLHKHQDVRRRCSRSTAGAAAARSASRRSRRSSPRRGTSTSSTPKHRAAAGHQRSLPRQHPARRHLLGRAARRRAARSRPTS